MRLSLVVRASHAAAAHPRRVLTVFALLTLLPLGGLLRLRRDTDADALVPPDDPAIRIDRELRARFDLRDQVIVYIDGGRPGAIFDARLLRAVRAISDGIAAIPGIGPRHVTSLATEARDRLYAGSGTTFGTFLDVIPQPRRELQELREDLDLPSARIHTGTIVTADRRACAVVAGIPEGADLIPQIEAVVEPYRAEGLAIDVVGAPVAEALLAGSMARDLATFLPLSMLVVAVIIGFGTRRVAPVVMTLMKTAGCIAWTLAMLGWLGIPLYLTITIVPLVLTAACIGDEIHLVMRFQRALSETGSGTSAVTSTMDDVAIPIVAATSTTCIGFLSCAASAIAPVRALGIACALGIAWSLAFSLMASPALFAILPARWFRRATTSPARALPLTVRRPRAALTVIGLITVLAVLGAARVRIQDSWIECFAPGSDFRRATERVNAGLAGVHLLHAVIPRGSMAEPEWMARIQRIEETARGEKTVGAAIGAASQLDAVARFWRMDPSPRSARELDRLIHRFDLSPGVERRRRVINDERDAAVVTLFLKNANFRDTAAIFDRLAASGTPMAFAGDIAVSQAMIPAVIRSQIFSLPLSLLGVFASVAVLLGSPRAAAYAIAPAVLSGVWLLGMMGFAGIPLGVATSMFFAVSIGLGVDSHAIHLVARWRQTGDAAAAAREVAGAILINTAAVAAGFGLVIFSAIPPNRALGLLIAVGLVAGCAITLTGLTSLLVLRETVNPEEARSSPAVVHQRATEQEVMP